MPLNHTKPSCNVHIGIVHILYHTHIQKQVLLCNRLDRLYIMGVGMNFVKASHSMLSSRREDLYKYYPGFFFYIGTRGESPPPYNDMYILVLHRCGFYR